MSERSTGRQFCHVHSNASTPEAIALADSIRYWQKQCQVRPTDPKARNFLGLALRKKGRLADAAVEFRTSIRVDPTYLTAYQNLGVTLRKLGDLPGAIAAYKQAIDIQPNDALAWYNLGYVLHDQSEIRQAAAAFRRAVEADPKYVAGYNNLGVVLRKMGDYDGAAAAYRQAIALDPTNSTAHNNLGLVPADDGARGEWRGQVLDEAGDAAGAKAALEQAIAHNPCDPLYHNNMGIALCEAGDYNGAAKALQEGLAVRERDGLHRDQRVGPRAAAALCENLRFSYSQEGNPEGEISALRTMTQLQVPPGPGGGRVSGRQPSDHKAWNDLGVAFTKAKQYPDAITAFEKAIRIRGGDYGEAHNNLGMVLLETGNCPISIGMTVWAGKHPESLTALAIARRQSPKRELIDKNLNHMVKPVERPQADFGRGS